MSLGDSIRSLVNKIESVVEQPKNPVVNQRTIFEEIKERQDENRS